MSFAQFTTISPEDIIEVRPDGSSPHTFSLEWSYDPAITNYSKIRVFRWIGSLGETANDVSISDQYIILETTDIPAVSSMVDDMSSFYNGTAISTPLRVLYGLTGEVSSDQQLLHEISYSRRPIYYVIQTFVLGGAFDSAPYVITSHTSKGLLQCISTKTQVKHNTLLHEGHRVWQTVLREPAGGKPNKVSRTAVDVNRIYQDSEVHAGPTGIGGYAWCTNRDTGNGLAFCCELRTGKQTFTYRLPGQDQDNGCGIAIENTTGDALAAPYSNEGEAYRCSIDRTPGNYSGSLIGKIGHPCYGLVPVPGVQSPSIYYAASQSTITKLINTSSGWTKTSHIPSIGVYGIVSGPDASIFHTVPNGSNDFGVWDSSHGWQEFPAFWGPGGWINRGVTTDSAALYPNVDGVTDYNRYYVYTVDTGTSKLREAVWNKSTQTLTYANTYDTPFAPYGVAPDSENNIWAAGAGLMKYYRMKNDSVYPYGGHACWPQSSLGEWLPSFLNTREIEWFLTRDASLMTTPAYTDWCSLTADAYEVNTGLNGSVSYRFGTKVDRTTINDAITAVQEWSDTHGDNLNNIYGIRIYPKYTIPGTRVDFTNTSYNSDRGAVAPSYSYMYSDFTGSVLIGAIGELPASLDYIHPETTAPSCSLIISQARQSSPLGELVPYIWGDEYFNNQQTSVSGYDDLFITLSAHTNPGSFIMTGWNFYMDDHKSDYGNLVPNVVTEFHTINQSYTPEGTYETDVTTNPAKTYHDTTKVGLPATRTTDSRLVSGNFASRVVITTNIDPYTLDPVYTTSNTTSSTIMERWPEARLWVEPYEISATRIEWFDCPLSFKPPTRFKKTVGYINDNPYEQGNTAYGTDPLSADFWDRTIARTYPIETWSMGICTSNVYMSALQNWDPIDSSLFSYMTTWSWSTTDADRLPADTINSIIRGGLANIVTYNFWCFGYYAVSLSVNASTSNTQSGDANGKPQTFTQFLCVREFEPFANFWATSAITVPSTYSDDTIGTDIQTLLTDAQPPVQLPTTERDFVSGYAPNLTVWFTDSSEAHTFPISSYHWDFGDYYDEQTMTQVVTTDTITRGNFDRGCWKTDQTNHSVVHTYTMPGMYDVTLCVQASNTSTQDCCARYVNENIQPFYVYVEEIYPECCFEIKSPLSGISPHTINFLASCVTPGSFPICRLEWDWGDGTPIETISRLPYPTASNLNQVLTSVNAFSQDPNDPRNYLIAHTYTNTNILPATFNVTLSVYACNTNSISICTGQSVGPIVYPYDIVEPRHLIKSRYQNSNNDVVYILEGTELNSMYTVVLSGEK